MVKLSLHNFYFDSMARAHRLLHERYGQAMFNHLQSVRPDLAERVRGTDKDPFSCKSPTDPRFDRFIDFIESEWFNGQEGEG